jgi:hypothetical protein
MTLPANPAASQAKQRVKRDLRVSVCRSLYKSASLFSFDIIVKQKQDPKPAVVLATSEFAQNRACVHSRLQSRIELIGPGYIQTGRRHGEPSR